MGRDTLDGGDTFGDDRHCLPRSPSPGSDGHAGEQPVCSFDRDLFPAVPSDQGGTHTDDARSFPHDKV